MLRAKATHPEGFRRAVREISSMLLAEAAREWDTRLIEIETPLSGCKGHELARRIVLVPILRAGLGMAEAMSQILPEADVGHLGLARDPVSLQPSTYLCRLPADLEAAQVLLLDPMLATGNSACQAVALLKKEGARSIQFLCLVACPPGLERFRAAHPDVAIFTAAVDPELNDSGYIVPGLGDAGDRYFGTHPIH